MFHCIRGSFHTVLSLDPAGITGGARPVSRPVLTGYAGSLGSVTRRQLGTCLPHLDMNGKARLSKYMKKKEKNMNKRHIMQFTAPGKTSLWRTWTSTRRACAASMYSVHHIQRCDPIHVQCEIQHMTPMHAAVGSIKSKSAFYLTRDALFSYFSILRAQTVTPLSGELKWDCLLWYNAHITHPPTPQPPQQRYHYVQFARRFITQIGLIYSTIQA